jgi:prepilin-type N-terminal cleavage/methylation domain-containing protein
MTSQANPLREKLRTSFRDQRGFTLLELLITLSIFLIVLFSVYMVHETNTVSYERSEMRIDIQQNARVALATMERELRMAGYGVPRQLAGVSMISDARPRAITFRADLRNVFTSLANAATAGTNNLSVNATTGIAAGDIIYMTSGSKAEALTAHSVNTGTLTVTTTTNLVNSYQTGGRLYVPRDVRYTITGGQLLREERVPGGAWPPITPDNILADRIAEQNTFRYYDAGNNEITTNDPVVNPDSSIRRVRITLLASGTPSGLDLQTYTLVSDVRPRNL